MTCIWHTTQVCTCIKQGNNINSWHFHWEIWICLITYLNLPNIGRPLQKRGFTCKACQFVCSHSVLNSFSEEVSWKRFPISSPVKFTSSLLVTIITSLSSLPSTLATVDVSFHTEVNSFVELLLVGLGTNQTVFYQ